MREINTIKEKDFTLDFIYKTAPIIQRDLDTANEKRATKRKLIAKMIDEAKLHGLSDDDIQDMMKLYNTETRNDQK